MKNYLILIVTFTFLCSGMLHGQEWLDPKDLNPPTNLSYSVENENDVNLFWSQPSSGTSTYLHWDSGENDDSFGFFLSAEHFACAAKWDPDHLTNYDGWTITKLRFFVTSADPTIQIKLWTGEDATEVYSQDVPVYNVNEWTEVVLDEPFVIDAGMELMAGVDIDMPFAGSVMGTDSGPVISGYGDLVYWNNDWYTGWTAGNHNIQIEVTSPSDPVALHWDSGENEDSFGFFLSGEQFSCAGKWDPENLTDYDGWNITKMRFFVVDESPTIALKLWTGETATEVYTQDVTTFEANEWTEVALDEPHTIDASTQLRGGIYIDMPFAGAIMGLDGGPAIAGYGNLLYWNGSWYDDQVAANWNIQLELQAPDSDNTVSLLGYNVYRNDEVINEEPVPTTAYVDFNLFNGEYTYYVTALYDEGESDPSNSVLVLIDQPVILEADSLALVDLYDSCGGISWSMQENWLTGPLSEWYGITTDETRVTGVWLASNFLTGALPESFGDLTALETLHLESTGITAVPESFGNLTSLKECWLGWTEITQLPESFGNLESLEELHLGFLNLGKLPDSFGNLSSLKWLALGDSELDDLPDNFGDLTSLESCFLWGNNLEFLPVGFGGLESLNYLTLDNNQLTTLPQSFGDLDNLSKLYIEENQLTSLPATFGDLESLDSVSLWLNQLTALPDNWGDLDDLKYMVVSANSIEALPASFTDMESIKEIYMGYNQLTEIPEDIGNLTTLEWLVTGNNLISVMPESIVDLENLEGLFFSSAILEDIPDEIGNLSNLRFLELGSNSISSVPESIGELSSLGYISLSSNSITTLPETFGNLEADTVLLYSNDIEELPSTMFDNEYHFLYVEDNALQFGSLEPFIGQALVFSYMDQAKFGTDTIIEVVSGDPISLTLEVSGENNEYQWYKDGSLLAGQTSNTLEIASASASDQGEYVLKVSNTLVSDLVLTSEDVEVSYIVSVSENDQEAEMKLYPNPATSDQVTLEIKNPERVERISVMNFSGSIKLQIRNVRLINELSVSDFSPGIYLVEVQLTDGNRILKKLVIQ